MLPNRWYVVWNWMNTLHNIQVWAFVVIMERKQGPNTGRIIAFFHHTLNQMQLRNCIFFPWELSKSNYKLQALICICHDTHVNSKPKVWYAFWVKREAVNVLCKHALYTEMDFMPSLWVDYFRDCVVKSSIAWSVDIRFHFEEDDCCNNPPIINSSEL